MYRDAWIKVDLDAFKDNIRTDIKKTNKKIIAVIKADAYACGAKKIYSSALEAGVSLFGVSSLEEAVALRNYGCTTDILILGYVGLEYLDLVRKYDLTLTTISLDWVKELIKHQPENIKIQIKIDTGMNRIGIKSKEDLLKALSLLKENRVQLEGIFTHYACSDDQENQMTLNQFNIFKDMVNSCDTHFKWIHSSNSDASLSLNETFSNAVRIGISMLGINTYDKCLKNVLSLYCRIVNVKKVNRGESVSYGATYTTAQDEIIATVPIGYADGWLRRNQGRKVFVNNEYALIVGRICMDQLMIRLNRYAPTGTIVELFGEHIPIEDVAKENDTIPYEIITSLSDRLTRVYFENGAYLTNFNPRLNRSEN